MDWGLHNRLSRLTNPKTERTVMLAVDHGYFLGPTTNLEVPRRTIDPLLPHIDSLMLTRGVLRSSVTPVTDASIVLRVSGGVSILSDDLANEGLTTTVREAVRLNASAVAASVFIGSAYERQTLLNLGSLVNEAEEYGMPVLAVTAVGKELEKRDARYLALSCRIAAELGARIVKTYYCEGFAKVVEACPVPVVIAGGPKLPTELEVFQLAFDAISCGAVGVDMGRNIWQHSSPVAMVKAVGRIVHQGATPEEAMQEFRRVAGLETEARHGVPR
jgi:3-hydroxy-5-phosphonooxypentane-2,4-dione thiolase